MKRILSVLLVLAMIFSLAACGGTTTMTMGTGSPTGTYYAYGGIVGQYITNNAGINVNAVSTGGSKDNIQGIDAGDYQLGTVQSDVMHYAWNGTRSFEEDGKIDSFRTVAGLYAEAVQLVTVNPEIKSVSDLKDKKVSIGTPGSGVYFNAMDVLAAAGLTENDIKPQYQNFDESADALKDGQIMPPIMGAAAFLMAENIGVPYSNIVTRAILPACLYFLGVFIAVHLEAKKEGLRGLSKEELPRFIPLLKQSYLMLPLILLIALVGSGSRSIAYAAAIAIIATIVVGLFNKENRITPMRIFEALAAGGQGMITVAVACGVAGIIAGTITMTGLATMLINGILALAGDKVIIALFLTMLTCIVLGMGVPTTANYCIMAATCAPILIKMGVPDIAAHFFVFYFGIVADLTPPVALAAYAGAAIAQANPMKTAFTSTKLAIGAFIVPYVFALNPAMLFIDTTLVEVILICITSCIGIFAVSASLEGYFLHNMAWYERIISAIGGLLLIYPGIVTDVIGIALVGAVLLVQFITRKKTVVLNA